MPMNPDAGWRYVQVETTVTGAALRGPIALGADADDASGVWELLNLTIKRTAGLAAATFTPSIVDRDSGDSVDALWIANAAVSAAIATNATPGRTWKLGTGSPGASLPYFAPGANVAGDTWVMRSLWRRRAPV